MKKIFKLFTAAALLFAASCTNTELDRYDTSVENPKEAYFKNSTIDYEYAADAAGMETYELRIYRQNCKGAAEVYLHVVSAADALGVLSAPASVTFADGEYETAVPVKVDLDQFAPGSSYSTKISLMEEEPGFKELDAVKTDIKAAKAAKTRVQAGITTYSAVTLTFSKTLEWEPVYSLKDPSKLLSYDGDTMDEEEFLHDEDGNRILGGVFTYNFYWEGKDDEVVLMHAKKTTVFRMDNWGGGVSIVFTVKPNETVEVDGEEYPRLVVTEQYIGADYDENYGGVYIANPELVTWMYDDDAIDEFPNYWDGAYTFHFRWFYHFVGSTAYFDDQCYDETFVMAGYEDGADDEEEEEDSDPDPQVAIKYLGVSTSATGVKSYSLSFTPNSDVKRYYATVLRGVNEELDCTDEALAELDSNIEEYVAYFVTEYVGVDESDEDYDDYYSAYLNQYELYASYGMPEYSIVAYYFYDDIYNEILESKEEKYVAELEKICYQIYMDEYEGEFTAVTATKAAEFSWDLGTEGGMFTAIALSVDASEEFHQANYKVFHYNPEGDSASVFYYSKISGASGSYYARSGYFGDNVLVWSMQAPLGNITSVRYALVTEKAFADANLDADDTAGLKSYLAKNGRSLSASDIADMNNTSIATGGCEVLLGVKAGTAYKLISLISTADAERLEVVECGPEESEEHEDMYVMAMSYDYPAAGYYGHLHVAGAFWADHVAAGYYLPARVVTLEDGTKGTSSNDLNALISISDNGEVTLKDNTEKGLEALAAFVAKNANKFSSGSSQSDLDCMNNGVATSSGTIDYAMKLITTTPNTEIMMLGLAQHSDGTYSWAAAVAKTSFAPDVQFEQTVEVEGKNIKFLWEAWPEDDIFEIDAIEYALVSTSELTAAGVDLTMLGDEELNNFERRLDEGEDAGVIDAQKANAEAVESVLEAKGKVFSGDNIALKVNKGGFSGVFENNAAGQYALIAKTADAYNTKLTVAVVTVE